MNALMLAALLAGPALAQQPPQAESAVEPGEPQGLAEPPALAPPPTPEALDERTTEVSRGLRCPVCQGLSVNDSPADGARAMKARIRELVGLGYSQQQIEDYFVDRYGTWVLLAPPATGQHWTVYMAPIAFVLIGGGLIVGLLRQRRELSRDATEEVPRTPAQAEDALTPYRRRILAELGHAGEAR